MSHAAKILTAKLRAIAKSNVSKNIPTNPMRSKVLRPAFSTRTSEMIVMSTLMLPIPKVAYVALASSSPDIVKILVEKNIT